MVMNTKYLCFSDIFVCSFVCIPTLLKKPSVSKYLTTLAFRRIIKKNSLNIVDDRQQRKGKNFNGYSIKKKLTHTAWVWRNYRIMAIKNRGLIFHLP